MKKFIVIITIFIMFVGYFYLKLFYPHIDEMQSHMKIVDSLVSPKEIKSFKSQILQQYLAYETNSKKESSYSYDSASTRIRRSAMIAEYHSFYDGYKDGSHNGVLYLFGQISWYYFSLIHFDQEEICKLYIYTETASISDKIKSPSLKKYHLEHILEKENLREKL